MPLRLEIDKGLKTRSIRVKSVAFHPTEPWVLSGLYDGTATIWNYETEELVKSFEVSSLPVRSVQFVARKQWIVASGDDMHLTVFNYNTMAKVVSVEAHHDFVRYVEVHPILPILLTCSDDMAVKMWDWDKNWLCTRVFEGHGSYVMMAKFNPKDTNTFATAGFDGT
ncbi:hypothetical protein SPRG_13436, partial [Saprolegnia parasitica CBS 223.65]